MISFDNRLFGIESICAIFFGGSQDSAYFMFGKRGACATLNYACDTSVQLDNGPLFVVPGSHKDGHIPHVDTASHLGLPEPWNFEMALPVNGAAGDSLFFNIHTVHGSTPNRSSNNRASFINRYIDASDYQAYFATDTVMREKAKLEYEKQMEAGMLPKKERNFLVRGRRVYDGKLEWSMDARVNH